MNGSYLKTSTIMVAKATGGRSIWLNDVSMVVDRVCQIDISFSVLFIVEKSDS